MNQHRAVSSVDCNEVNWFAIDYYKQMTLSLFYLELHCQITGQSWPYWTTAVNLTSYSGSTPNTYLDYNPNTKIVNILTYSSTCRLINHLTPSKNEVLPRSEWPNCSILRYILWHRVPMKTRWYMIWNRESLVIRSAQFIWTSSVGQASDPCDVWYTFLNDLISQPFYFLKMENLISTTSHKLSSRPTILYNFTKRKCGKTFKYLTKNT